MKIVVVLDVTPCILIDKVSEKFTYIFSFGIYRITRLEIP
jgi:hypothetical protein